MIRIKDVELLRNNNRTDTIPYKIFKDSFNAVLKFIDIFPNFSFVFCFHPAEIQLMLEEKIYPPFYEELIARNIKTNIDHVDSLAYYSGCHFGISTMSTAVCDLWHLNKKAFMFSTEQYESYYLHGHFQNYLTDHKKFLFNSGEELFQMLQSTVIH